MELEFQGPYSLDKKIDIGASKSYSIRALLVLLIYPYPLQILGLGDSMDEQAAKQLILSLLKGLVINSESQISSEGGFDFDQDVILRCEESGLLARMLSMLFLLNQKPTEIQGVGSLNQRPLSSALNFYQNHQIPFHANGIYLPIQLYKFANIEDVVLDGSESSQYISGLIYYFLGKKDLKSATITIKNIVSKPYIDMTIELVNQLGASVQWQDDNTIKITPFGAKRIDVINIEKDWSSAAVWIVAATIGGRIEIAGLNPQSLQADTAILNIVKQVGAYIEWTSQGHLIIEKKDLNPFDIDATDFPDLIPILSVLAYFIQGQSKIKGVNRLINKESNRKEAILNGFHQLHYKIEESKNEFIFNPSSKSLPQNQEIQLNSYGDHRMVMAWSILALQIPNRVVVTDVESVRKSYVDFETEIKKIIE